MRPDGSVQSTIPRIISVDDHVVEPSHVWESRLPARHRAKGPRVVLRPRGIPRLVDGVWVEQPGEDGPLAAWWHYEDHLYQMRLMIACPGLKPEEVKPIGVTFSNRHKRITRPKR